MTVFLADRFWGCEAPQDQEVRPREEDSPPKPHRRPVADVQARKIFGAGKR